MSHMQEMKDELIEVANKLLDGDGEFNPEYSEELRKKRFDFLSYQLLFVFGSISLSTCSNVMVTFAVGYTLQSASE